MLKELVQAQTCGLNRDLPVIELNGERLLTTELLAQVYNTDIKNISNNFNRNKEKFIEGKHYFLLQGPELKEFKAIHLKDESLKFVSQLYLWTERGANRHCKILDTDKAWEQFDNLEETYFRVKEQKPNCIEDVLIQSLREMKDLKQQVDEVNNNALSAKVTATKVETKVDDFIESSPLFNVECDELIKTVNSKAKELMGYRTPAYNNRSLRGKIYSDIHYQIRREFGVKSYKAIRRVDLNIAKSIVANYGVPLVLQNEITKLNNQIKFSEVV